MKKNETFLERLLEELNFSEKFMRYNSYMISVYRHLLEILLIKEPKRLDHMFEKVGGDFDDAFYSFHKGFRSWDTFSEYYIKITPPQLTDDQKERLVFLNEKMKRDNLPENWVKDEQYIKWHQEKLRLNEINRDEGYRSIGGHLDMIFWNTIHSDKDGVMYKTLKSLMQELKEEQEV